MATVLVAEWIRESLGIKNLFGFCPNPLEVASKFLEFPRTGNHMEEHLRLSQGLVLVVVVVVVVEFTHVGSREFMVKR